MTKEVKNVPDLRFSEFKGAWEEKKLSDVGYYSKSYPYSRAIEGEGIIHHIHYGDIHSKLPSKINDINLLPTIVENRNFEFVKKGDIIFADASEDYKDLGKAVLVNIEDNNIIASLHTHVFRLNKEISAEFLMNFTKTLNYYKFIKKQGTGISVLGISKKNLSNLTLNIPEYNEQQKIGIFFSKLDRQIELEEQKLAKLEEQKKGYMQKIFSQELRFKDENGNEYPDWSKTFIKDIFIFENNRRKPITSSLREKGNYPYYGATGIIDYVKDYLFDNEERLLIGEDGAKWGQFETSSFIANGKYWVNNHAHVVKSNDHNLYFMNYYLNFKELKTFVTGNAPAKLTHANLCSISIEMPIRNEQDKISHLLKSIEIRINNQNTKIQLLQQRKQGLLQKMFV